MDDSRLPIERSVNLIPLGYLSHKSGGVLLRVLTHSNLTLITTSDRFPAGMFNVPDCPEDLVQSIEEKYDIWYEV